MFTSILGGSEASTLSIGNAAICMGVAIVLGAIIAFAHKKTSKTTKNFFISLIVLPLLVQVVIIMVNGNLGTSVAVLGAFSLVRFRSIPGNSKEILSIFWAMAVGLACGMGHIAFAAAFTILLAVIVLIIDKLNIFKNSTSKRRLKIIIPENLDYAEVFDDIFKKNNVKADLEKVKTVNMGSMYELTYNVELNKEVNDKSFIDELRCRNGNLTISLSRENLEEIEL